MRNGRAPRRASVARYFGAAGSRERYYLALLNNENEIIRRVSGDFASYPEAIIAWVRRRDPRARLIREATFLDVLQ